MSTRQTTYDRHYKEQGFGYEEDRPKWERWVRAHYIESFGLQPGEKLLDAGCGDGFWTSLFAAEGFEAVGFDLSEGGIETARERYPGPEFLVANAEEPLPFPPESFNIVFCRSLSHLCRRELLTEPTFRVFENLKGCLAPGGALLVSYFSRRDGLGPETAAYHRVSDLVRIIEPFADPFKVEVVNDYVQIAAQRRDAPRSRR